MQSYFKSDAKLFVYAPLAPSDTSNRHHLSQLKSDAMRSCLSIKLEKLPRTQTASKLVCILFGSDPSFSPFPLLTLARSRLGAPTARLPLPPLPSALS